MRQVTLSDLNVRLSEDKTHVLIELDNTQLKVTLEEAVNVANIIEMTAESPGVDAYLDNVLGQQQ